MDLTDMTVRLNVVAHFYSSQHCFLHAFCGAPHEAWSAGDLDSGYMFDE